MSLVMTTAALVVVRVLSNPAAVAAAKRRMHAALLEMRLFKHDERAMLRAAFGVVRSDGIYLRTLALPLAVTAVSLIPLLAHLDSFYGSTGVSPGTAAIITVRLRTPDPSDDAQRVPPPATLEAPDAVCVETPALWFPATRDIVWRVRPQSAGSFAMRIRIGATTYAKTLHASDDIVRLAASRVRADWLDGLLDPADTFLPANGDVASIDVAYPRRDIEVLGYRVHWLVLVSGLSLLCAIVLRKPLGVTF